MPKEDTTPLISHIDFEAVQPKSSRNPPRVKKEEAGDNIIDLTLPDAPALPAANSDFDPFDGSDDDSVLSDLEGFDEECVDDSEGVMETRNGVQYFVCRSKVPLISTLSEILNSSSLRDSADISSSGFDEICL